MSIQIVRNTRMWVSLAVGESPTYLPANTFEIEVQDDFSFSQDNNTSDISVEEAGPTPTRGSKRFNDSLSPADWSFTSYLQPYFSTPDAGIVTPDMVMWHALATGLPFDLATPAGVESTATNMLVKFEDNSTNTLVPFDLIFHVDNVWYKITNCQVGSAALGVDITDLGKVSWTGQGRQLIPLAAAPFTDGDTTTYTAETLAAPYIENRLTTLQVTNNDGAVNFSIPITGASIDINNNVTYIMPNTLARVDQAVASYAGSFDISGTLEAYLRTNETGDGGTAELLAAMLANSEVTNSYTIAVIMGGKYAVGSPSVVLVMKQAQLSIPTVETGDLLSTSISFKGIPTELDAGDEGYLGMSPTYTAIEIDALIATGDGTP